MYAATRLFASNLNVPMAQRFYNLVLLPRVRQDIADNRRLHYALFMSLKKATSSPRLSSRACSCRCVRARRALCEGGYL